MLRITRQTDYGIVLLSLMAQREQGAGVHTARGLSDAARLPLPMVGKILTELTRSGLLASHRGTKGGYRLSRPAAAMSVAEIIVALEGPIGLTACLPAEASDCEQKSICRVQGAWARINRVVRDALEGVSLAEISGDRTLNLSEIET
ncbi:MAG: SUF system Fe-S cluster assembly regulator [Gemmatimonadetes bacterium]|nr:SUF system Fe-S cluster assembly regulator [Gemmatimonadota bacterium]